MKKLILLAVLLISIQVTFGQIANLGEPLRKSETYIRNMMKNPLSINEGYDSYGKFVNFNYANYTYSFGFSDMKCRKVFITSKSSNIDEDMYKYIYNNGYEKSGGLWGKMISIKTPDGNTGAYPVALQKLDNTSWQLIDLLEER